MKKKEFRPAFYKIYEVGSKSYRPDQLFKVTERKQLCYFFNIVSLYFNTLFNWYINLTIDGTIYPSQHFPFGAAFVCHAGNFWTLLRKLKMTRNNVNLRKNLLTGSALKRKKSRHLWISFTIWRSDLFGLLKNVTRNRLQIIRHRNIRAKGHR
jgi:hypothetical protein